MHYLKLLPCEGEVAPSAGSEGFLQLFEPDGAKISLGSARNPSVSADRDTFPSQGRRYLSANFTHTKLVYKDMLLRRGVCTCRRRRGSLACIPRPGRTTSSASPRLLLNQGGALYDRAIPMGAAVVTRTARVYCPVISTKR